MRKCHATEREEAHQPQFEQLGDDPVEHSSVVLLVDLVGDFLDDVLGCQRSAVHLAEALWVVCADITQCCEMDPSATPDPLLSLWRNCFYLL